MLSKINANQLSRIGCFTNGWNGTTTWSRNGKKFSSIGLRATANYLHLGYSPKHYFSVIQPIRIERLPCRFEGSRAYFSSNSGKRVVKLYGFGRLFLCRHCSGLFHYSKNESFWDRSLRQQKKHKRRLSGGASLEAYEIPKPKGRGGGACGGGRFIAFIGLLRGQRTVRRMTLLLLLGGW